MSKERLEEIKKHRNDADKSTDEYEFEKINFYNLHVDWLIEQAERVQELENHIDYLYDNNVHLKGDCRLQEQNKRYRVAIRECIERMNEGGAGTRSFVYEKLIEVLEGNNDA